MNDRTARPILLHLPHASSHIPSEFRDEFLLSEEEFRRESVAMTDAFTDELFDLGELADRLVFPVSRLLVDPERFERDEDEPMAARGMGAVYEKTHDGRPLKRVRDRDRLMDLYYRPHHRRLTEWTSAALSLHGRCLILDGHSFPSVPLPCDLDQTPRRPDICIGTSSVHTPAGLRDAVATAFDDFGFSVKIDEPYAGTIVPMEFYGREPRVSSIMVEINRGLYMDETTGAKAEGFPRTRAAVTEALTAVCSRWLADRLY